MNIKFKIGDRVRFLNEKGEGIITAIENWKTAFVAIDGFEVPYPIDQLVLINTSAKKENNPAHIAPVVNSPIKTVKQEETYYPAPEEPLEEGIYLLFEPTDERRLLEAPIDIAVVNNTVYNIFFTYSYKYSGEYVTMFSGKASQFETINVDTLQRGNADQYANIKIDVLFYRNIPYTPLAPVSEVVKIKTIKFYKETTYRKTDLSNKKAYIINVSLIADQKEGIDKDKLQSAVAAFPAAKKKTYDPDKISKPHTVNNSLLEREIDLHLEEIVEDMRGMTNGQKLQHQLNYFTQCLDQAIVDNLRSIVFIHGVGNGRLKAELRKILDTYKGLRYHDASFRSYGFGATEVVFY